MYFLQCCRGHYVMKVLVLWSWKGRFLRLCIHNIYTQSIRITEHCIPVPTYIYIYIYIYICKRTGNCCTHCIHGLATGLSFRPIPAQYRDEASTASIQILSNSSFTSHPNTAAIRSRILATQWNNKPRQANRCPIHGDGRCFILLRTFDISCKLNVLSSGYGGLISAK